MRKFIIDEDILKDTIHIIANSIPKTVTVNEASSVINRLQRLPIYEETKPASPATTD